MQGYMRTSGDPPVSFQGMYGFSFIVAEAHRGSLGAKPQRKQAPLRLPPAPQSRWSQRGQTACL